MKQQNEIKPFSNWQVLFILGTLICALGLIGLPGRVERNGELFLDFAQNADASDIQEIDIQRTDSVEEPIIINDEKAIIEFVAMPKTLQRSEFFRNVGDNYTTITIRLKDGQIHEFECYTLEYTGKRMHIAQVFFSKNSKFSYSFGNLNAQFPNDNFYNWLISVGIAVDK